MAARRPTYTSHEESPRSSALRPRGAAQSRPRQVRGESHDEPQPMLARLRTFVRPHRGTAADSGLSPGACMASGCSSHEPLSPAINDLPATRATRAGMKCRCCLVGHGHDLGSIDAEAVIVGFRRSTLQTRQHSCWSSPTQGCLR